MLFTMAWEWYFYSLMYFFEKLLLAHPCFQLNRPSMAKQNFSFLTKSLSNYTCFLHIHRHISTSRSEYFVTLPIFKPICFGSKCSSDITNIFPSLTTNIFDQSAETIPTNKVEEIKKNKKQAYFKSHFTLP